jgi:hypothetical protein
LLWCPRGRGKSLGTRLFCPFVWQTASPLPVLGTFSRASKPHSMNIVDWIN